MIESFNAPAQSLYVHVPFCAQKCNYCAFYSEAANGEVINRYVQALLRELEIVAADLRPQTIFFGGGTPSLLNLRQWEQILQTMARLGLANAADMDRRMQSRHRLAGQGQTAPRLRRQRFRWACNRSMKPCLTAATSTAARWFSSPLIPCAPPDRQYQSRPHVRHSRPGAPGLA